MCNECPIADYVDLRPKMYSKNIKNTKGVKNNGVKKCIRRERYKEALFSKQTFRHGIDVLRSERHGVSGQHLNKVSLFPFDSKRWMPKMG